MPCRCFARRIIGSSRQSGEYSYGNECPVTAYKRDLWIWKDSLFTKHPFGILSNTKHDRYKSMDQEHDIKCKKHCTVCAASLILSIFL